MTDDVEATDSDFLHFMYARYSPERNDREGSLVWSLGGLQAGDRVMDLACGWGRIADYLTTAGAEVVGLDNSKAMIDAARAAVPTAEFVLGDMRDIAGLGMFDAVVFWWSSFGIFDDDTDLEILRQIRSVLRPGGRLILETANAPVFYIEASANRGGKTSHDRVGDDVMIDTRELSPDGRRLLGRREMWRGSRVSEMTYQVRLFTGSELERWLLAAGFTAVSLYGRSGDPLDWKSYSVIAVGTA